MQREHPPMPVLHKLSQGGGPHADDTLSASRVQREHHALQSLTPAVTVNMVPPAHRIHSVHPMPRGSTMHSGCSLWPSLSKYGAPCADDTLGASRAQRGHCMLQLISCPSPVPHSMSVWLMVPPCIMMHRVCHPSCGPSPTLASRPTSGGASPSTAQG